MVDQQPAPEARHGADALDLLGDLPVLCDLDIHQPLHRYFVLFCSSMAYSASSKVNTAPRALKRDQPRGRLSKIDRRSSFINRSVDGGIGLLAYCPIGLYSIRQKH